MNFSKTYTTVGTKDIVRLSPAETSFSVNATVEITGVIDVTVEYTVTKPNMEVNTPPGGTYDNWADAVWLEDTALTNLTATATRHVDNPVEGMRIIINSVTGGTVTVTLIQGDKA